MHAVQHLRGDVQRALAVTGVEACGTGRVQPGLASHALVPKPAGGRGCIGVDASAVQVRRPSPVPQQYAVQVFIRCIADPHQVGKHRHYLCNANASSSRSSSSSGGRSSGSSSGSGSGSCCSSCGGSSSLSR